MADGVLSLKGTLVGARGSGSGGHVIKDNGTAVTQRPTMNMTDFDIADDNTNEETDIKPHRITSAEMSEICSPLPDAPTLVGNVRMSLLWTNPSPTSEFAAQDILENVADYDFVLICAGASGYIKCVYCKYGTKTIVTEVGTSSSNITFSRRIFEFSNHKVSCTKGQYQKQGSSITDDNGVLVPQYIYGIKLL